MKLFYGLMGLMLLTGCVSVADLGEGRFAVPETVEVRSPFGTNAGYVRLQNCEKIPATTPGLSQVEYANCHTIHGWTPIQSQGQGGQVAAGAAIGLGFGLGSAFSGASGANASASSSSTAISGKGH